MSDSWRLVLTQTAARDRLLLVRRIAAELAQVQEQCWAKLDAQPDAAWTVVLTGELRPVLAQIYDAVELAYRRARDRALAAALKTSPSMATMRAIDAAVQLETQIRPMDGPELAQASLELSVWGVISLTDSEDPDLEARLGRVIDSIAALMLDYVLDRFDFLHRSLESAISPVAVTRPRAQ